MALMLIRDKIAAQQATSERRAVRSVLEKPTAVSRNVFGVRGAAKAALLQ